MRQFNRYLKTAAVAVAAAASGAYLLWEANHPTPSAEAVQRLAIEENWSTHRADGREIVARDAALGAGSVDCEKNRNWPNNRDLDSLEEQFWCVARFAGNGPDPYYIVFGATQAGVVARLLGAATEGYVFRPYSSDNQKIALTGRGLLRGG